MKVKLVKINGQWTNGRFHRPHSSYIVGHLFPTDCSDGIAIKLRSDIVIGKSDVVSIVTRIKADPSFVHEVRCFMKVARFIYLIEKTNITTQPDPKNEHYAYLDIAEFVANIDQFQFDAILW